MKRDSSNGDSCEREIVEKLSVNGVLCSRLQQALSDVYSVQKVRTGDAVSEKRK